MKITKIYEQYNLDLQTKDPNYKKLAVLNYLIAASDIFINLLFILILKIPNSLPTSILSVLIIFYLSFVYFVNFVFAIISIVNVYLHFRITRNLHFYLSLICAIILLILSILSIILL